MDEEETRDWERLCELIWGCSIGQAIHVSVELGVFEVLGAGPATTDELATAVQADAWVLETVLRALVAHGVLKREGAQHHALTGMGRLLLKSAPGPSCGEAGEFFETLYGSLGALMTMVKTGEVGFDHVYGTSFYQHLAERSTLATHFYDSMQKNAASRYAGLSSIVDFSGVSCVVDVGGAEGSLLVQLLGENTGMRGVLFDLPLVSDRAKLTLADAGLLERCSIVCGDFHEQVPRGGDVYILAQILNNWRDEEARRVLINCHEAMSEGASLLVLEPVLRDETMTRWRSLVSLGVMAQRGGRSRTEIQMRSLLGSANFELEDVRPLPQSATCAVRARRT